MINSNASVTNRILRAGITFTGTRFLYRSIDVIKMIVIARLIGPKEMGLYAVAAVMIGALEQLSETGLRHAIIQYSGAIDEYIKPARTLLAMRGLLLAILIWLLAPMIAGFFKSPDSLPVLKIMAILPFIRGLEPLSLTRAQRELRFGPLVITMLISSVLSLIVGVSIAMISQSAWALVWCSLASALIMTVGATYIATEHERHFSFKFKLLGPIRIFSKWVFLNATLAYTFMKGGEWIIGRYLNVESLAIYQMAFLISTALMTELTVITSQVIFPSFCIVQKDLNRLRDGFCKALGVISVMVFLVGTVLYCSVDTLVFLVLGAQWNGVVQLIPWLTIWGVSSVLSSVFSSLFFRNWKAKIMDNYCTDHAHNIGVRDSPCNKLEKRNWRIYAYGWHRCFYANY